MKGERKLGVGVNVWTRVGLADPGKVERCNKLLTGDYLDVVCVFLLHRYVTHISLPTSHPVDFCRELPRLVSSPSNRTTYLSLAVFPYFFTSYHGKSHRRSAIPLWHLGWPFTGPWME